MKYTDILGQDRIKAHLRRAVAENKAAHAYIIEGEKGSGKMMLARAFAQALVCESYSQAAQPAGDTGTLFEDGSLFENGPKAAPSAYGGDPCCVCPACMKAEGGNHPDIIYVNHAKPALISVEEIRSQLVADIAIKPYFAVHKVYIVDDAGLMNQNAQNALLKTLEEPPAYGVIILLTDNASLLLPTIRSRCVRLSMTPVPKEDIRAFLMESYEIVDYRAEAAAAYSLGNVGAAVGMATSNEENERRDRVVSILRGVRRADSGEIVAAVRSMEEEKAFLPGIFNLMTLWFRDVLLYKSTGDTGGIIFSDETRAIADTAEDISYSGISKVLEAIDTARRRLRGNVSFATSMELLFRTMRETA